MRFSCPMRRPLSGKSRSMGQRLARARERWRDAAQLVSTRWDVFLSAEAEARAFAFQAYLAALDAEEAAATAMAELVAFRGVTGS
jgi:hypothetical protein